MLHGLDLSNSHNQLPGQPSELPARSEHSLYHPLAADSTCSCLNLRHGGVAGPPQETAYWRHGQAGSVAAGPAALLATCLVSNATLHTKQVDFALYRTDDGSLVASCEAADLSFASACGEPLVLAWAKDARLLAFPPAASLSLPSGSSGEFCGRGAGHAENWRPTWARLARLADPQTRIRLLLSAESISRWQRPCFDGNTACEDCILSLDAGLLLCYLLPQHAPVGLKLSAHRTC